jgi:hypothetical protein
MKPMTGDCLSSAIKYNKLLFAMEFYTELYNGSMGYGEMRELWREKRSEKCGTVEHIYRA